MTNDTVLPVGNRLLITGVVFLALAFGLFPFTSEPRTWDDLYYIGVAHMPTKQAWTLNRYVHIYALAGIMRLVENPLDAARILWCVSVAGTFAIIVHVLTTVLPRWQALLATTVAGAIMFSNRALLFSAGLAYADVTNMPLLMLALALVVIRYHRHEDLTRLDALALGLLFMIAFKTKELGIIVGFTTLLFFVTRDDDIRFDRNAFRLVLHWVAGLASGLIMIAIIDQVSLGDLLFSVRPSNWGRVLGYNVGSTANVDRLSLVALVFGPAYAPTMIAFICFAIASLARARSLRLAMINLMPVVFLLLLATITLLSSARAVERHLTPVFPLVALLTGLAAAAAMPGSSGADGERPQLIKFVLACVLGAEALLIILVVLFTPVRAGLNGVSQELIPVLVIMFVLAAFLGNARHGFVRPAAFTAVLILLVTSATVVSLPRAARFFGGEYRRIGESRFADFKSLTAQLEPTTETRILFAEALTDRRTLRSWALPVLVRLYSDVRMPRQNVRIGEGREGFHPDYIVLSASQVEDGTASPACTTDGREPIISGRFAAFTCVQN